LFKPWLFDFLFRNSGLRCVVYRLDITFPSASHVVLLIVDVALFSFDQVVPCYSHFAIQAAIESRDWVVDYNGMDLESVGGHVTQTSGTRGKGKYFFTA